MLKARLTRLSSASLPLGAFCLANVSVLVTVLWLIPGLVYLEALAWIVLAALAVWILSVNGNVSRFRTILLRNWYVLPFVVYAGLSIAWSVYWQVSLSRWLILAATVLVGAFIGLRWELPRIVRLLSIMGICVLLASAAAVVLAPRYGIMNYYIIQGAWKGIYWHKNHMGLIAAFFCIVFLFEVLRAWRPSNKTFWLWGCCYVLALLVTYESASVAAYLVLILLHLGLALLLGFRAVKHRLRVRHYAGLLVLGLLAAAILYANVDRVLGVFNRNSTLTGRVPMWGHLFDLYVSQRPLDGYGFNAFWYIDAHRTTMQLVAGYPDPIVISDNGFIDVLLNTGYVGLALFLVFYGGLWFEAVRHAWKTRGLLSLFPVLIMAYSLVANATWSLLFENESFLMLVMITLVFSVSSSALPQTS